MMKSLNVGTLMLGSLMSSASLPAQQPETEQAIRLPAIPAEDPAQQASPVSEQHLAEIISDLKAGLIRFQQLTPEEKRNEKILLAGLADGENHFSALDSLTTDDFNSAAVRKAVVEAIGTVYPIGLEKEPYWAAMLRHPLGRSEVFPAITQKTVSTDFGDVNGLLAIIKLYAPAESRQSITETVTQQTRTAYLHPEGDFKPLFVPDCLRKDPEVVSAFVDRLKSTGSSVPYSYLTELGLEEEVCLELFKGMRNSVQNDFDQLIYMAPDILLLGEWRGDYLRELKSGARSAIGRLSSELTTDPEIAAAVRETFKRQPELLNAMRRFMDRGLGEDSSFALEVYREILSDTSRLDRIVKIIANDYTLIDNFPEQILMCPRVSFGIRSELNYLMATGRLTQEDNERTTVLPSGRSVQLFPELLWADVDAAAADRSAYLYNPRALVARVQDGAGRTTSPWLTSLLLRMQEAAAVLNISEFGRFDNAYELFRNRYQVSTPEVQQQLTALLGDAYFANIEPDNRPLCVVVNPASYADHNGAFLSKTNLYLEFDTIDLLTCHYQVLYFEAEDEADLARDILGSLDKMPKTIDLLILGGHGSPTGISFGRGNSLFRKGAGRLGVEDEQIFKRLGSLVTPDGRIILESCSTGGGPEGQDNVALIVHRYIPHAHIYAPKSDTARRFIFDANGRLVDIDYIFARKVHIFPDGRIETEAEISSRMSDVMMWAVSYISYAGELLWNTAKDFLMYLGALTLTIPLAGHIIERVRSLFPRKKEEKGAPKERQLWLFDPDEL